MRNFDRDRMVLFHEKYVFDGIIEDRLFDLFSNSYMVVIGKEPEITYAKYSNDRAREYMLRTEMAEIGGQREIRKIPMTEAAAEHVKKMEEYYRLLEKRYQGSGLSVNPCTWKEEGYAVFPFEKGRTLEALLDECLEQDDMEGFYELFDRYLKLISFGEEEAVCDYDLIFANILVDGDKWTVIDYEWTMEKQIPAKEIAFRAVYCYVLEEEKRNKLNLDYIIERLGITPAQADEYREKELKFQKSVTGKRKSMGEIRATIGTYSVDPKVLMEQHLQEILDKRIQIYTDCGNGFSEAESYYLPDIYTEENLIEAEIPFDGNVKALRIDPADRCCMVKVRELLVNGVAVPLNKKQVITNGTILGKDGYVFATNDPNMTILMDGIPRTGENTLSVKLEIAPLTSSLAQTVADSRKKLFG